MSTAKTGMEEAETESLLKKSDTLEPRRGVRGDGVTESGGEEGGDSNNANLSPEFLKAERARKMKDLDMVTVWFVGMAFSLAAVILILLPLFECTIDVCNEDEGQISVSSVIEYLPLATIYAVFGAVTLTFLCYFQVKACKRGTKTILAVLGYGCLLVPLMLPLSVEGAHTHIHTTCAHTNTHARAHA